MDQPDQSIRVIAISSHPVQYAAPLYRAIARRSDLTFRVLFRSLEGAEDYLDEGYGQAVRWDVPLLDGFEWSTCGVPRSGSVNQFKAFVGVFRELRKLSFDVVLVDGYRTAEALAAITIAEARRKDWFLGSDATRPGGDQYPRPIRWIARRLFKAATRRASGVACMSAASERFSLSLGARKTVNRIATVNPDVFVAPAERLEPVKGELRVLSVGRMLDWKRLDTLISAVRATPGVSLRFVGSGPEMKRLQQLSAGLECVSFVGMKAQTELPAEYYQADVLAIASYFEPFGVVAIEAAACGTPLIADATAGSCLDLVDGAKAGWKVAHVGDWPAALARVRDNPAERLEASERALAAAADFHPDQVASRLMSLLFSGRRLINSRPAAAAQVRSPL